MFVRLYLERTCQRVSGRSRGIICSTLPLSSSRLLFPSIVHNYFSICTFHFIVFAKCKRKQKFIFFLLLCDFAHTQIIVFIVFRTCYYFLVFCYCFTKYAAKYINGAAIVK